MPFGFLRLNVQKTEALLTNFYSLSQRTNNPISTLTTVECDETFIIVLNSSVVPGTVQGYVDSIQDETNNVDDGFFSVEKITWIATGNQQDI